MIVTIPKEVINIQNVKDSIVDAQKNKTAPQLRELFSKTVEGWKNPPSWGEKQEIIPSRIAISVFATGENADQYKLVTRGAPPHPILAINSGMLHFQPGYTPSTARRVLSSRAFSRFGKFISTQSVHHPGFEARDFDIQVAIESSDDFAKDMQDAILKGTLKK
jgi:hypothetical protein